MEIEYLRKIRTIAIKAMVSDDELMERLVLKGGNAIDIIYGIAQRGSIDLDFSIEKDFHKNEREDIKERIDKALTTTFAENNYKAFDIKFGPRPTIIRNEVKSFWGGYRIEFKIIRNDKLKELGHELDTLRRNAEVIAPGQVKTFHVDISKFEFCTSKSAKEIDGLTIYVYTPQMLVFEKLRAICQQLENYVNYVGGHPPVPRARDFFDIYILCENCQIDFASPDSRLILKNIFKAKKVDLKLLNQIIYQKDFHETDFDMVRDTVHPGINLKDFDFYFNYVIGIVEKLKSLGII